MISRKIKKALGLNRRDENGDCVFVMSVTRNGTVDKDSYQTFPDALDGALEDWVKEEPIPTVIVFQDLLGNPQGTLIRDVFKPEIAHLVLADGVVRHFRSFLLENERGITHTWTYPVDDRGRSVGKARRLGNPLEQK